MSRKLLLLILVLECMLLLCQCARTPPEDTVSTRQTGPDPTHTEVTGPEVTEPEVTEPEITEYIAWSMPYYKKNGTSVSFAACKTYISFYLGAEILENFGSELTGFKIKKNAVYLPYDKELPSEIIEVIIKQLFSKTNQNG